MLDKDLREILFEFLEYNYNKIRILEERPIGRARADVVTVTDKLIGYEIKSDSDSYTRLKNQIKYYDQFFDENYVVVGKSHAKGVIKKIPDYWGVICISIEDEFPEPIIDILRFAQPNPKCTLKHQLSLLWKRELLSILSHNSLPKYKQKSKMFIINKIINSLTPDIIIKNICDELFERDYTQFD